MKETDAKPSLRISHIVYGRTFENGRVKYLVDSNGAGDERAIPEEVVLRRWRRRRFPGYVFSGERLSPTLWRAIAAMLGLDPRTWLSLDVNALRRIREAHAETLREQRLTAPAAETLHALLMTCQPHLLTALVERHSRPDRVGRSGVPDLFLFARDGVGRPGIARFVEVKKPEEPVSRDQLEEIAIMQQHRMHVRILRLIERELPKK